MTISSVPIWDKLLKILADPSVSEIETNGPNGFFIKKSGQRVHLDNFSSGSEEEYMRGIQQGLAPFVESMNDFSPTGYLYEGRLRYNTDDGAEVLGRCHIVLPPACDFPQVTIAKKTASLKTIEAIASMGTMSTEMLAFLIMAVKSNLTVVFSGGTGAGKTTMLEALSKHIPDETRVGIAEDTPELILSQPNVSYLRSVPWQPGMDSNDVATLSWVVQQFQRMRTDKIIIGETRGKEFADFLVAANSGMEGSMTTMHADDPMLCLNKMTNFALKGAPNQPIRSINADIANAVDIIVQLVIIQGKHRISHIQEITTTLGTTEEAKITTEPLYRWDRNQDKFYKGANMSDNMRTRLADKGVKVNDFLNSQRDARVSAHGVNANAAAPDTVRPESRAPMQRGGLPTGLGRRSL